MERGLYIAASGMVGEMLRQEQIANDLANATTPGYKRDRAVQKSFGDMLVSDTVTGRAIGEVGMGATIDRIETDTSAAPVRDTGEAMDFAIVGDGFFAVATAAGERYTRNGRFMRAADGSLVTATGDKVLGPDGRPVQVGADGRVAAREIGVFAVTGAAKEGEALWTGRRAGAADGTVRESALEGSGVDATRTMVDMIASMRAFEAGQRTIATIDETLGKAVNQVASTSG